MARWAFNAPVRFVVACDPRHLPAAATQKICAAPKRSANAGAILILDSLLVANLAANFSHWAQIRSNLTLIRVAIPERCRKFPARVGREFVLPAQGNFSWAAGNSSESIGVMDSGLAHPSTSAQERASE